MPQNTVTGKLDLPNGPRQTKIGLTNQGVQKIGGKNTAFSLKTWAFTRVISSLKEKAGFSCFYNDKQIKVNPPWPSDFVLAKYISCGTKIILSWYINVII